ncbi:hypothetical protein [Vibrio sagamiensis]|uniref:Uncharacterized protein n=1 Tax=Vibrio sagamiensis NBRC 104589 TaxID=1219064 RepID=A0A511QHF4_9VIBR|nr:hypothetical protein [Vibrio sagamiensis]GEM76745.1 hypothetical protein VSA01S_28570 [Vibrio sagamiensis NBRC 104589]
MEKYCPICHTEMIDRSNYFICPRNNIGECIYDGYEDKNLEYQYNAYTNQYEMETATLI